jgi:hypothetical protein
MRTLIPLATAAVLTAAVARAEAEAPTMKADPHALHAESALAALDATFVVDAAQHVLHVEYSVTNRSAAPLMVLDGGVALAGKIGAGGAAPVGMLDGDALTLTHAAAALPKPAPTVPRVTLATRIEPGATHASTFEADVPPGAKRVRYCVGVAPFDEASFTPFEADGALWRTSFAVAATQKLVCSAWYDIARGDFVD